MKRTDLPEILGVELRDQELERVAGGKGGNVNNSKSTGRHYSCNHSAAIGTRLTVNTLGPGTKTSNDQYLP